MKMNIFLIRILSVLALESFVVIPAAVAFGQNTLLSNNNIGFQGNAPVWECYAGAEIVPLGDHTFIGLDGTLRRSPISGGAASLTPVFGFSAKNDRADMTLMAGSGGALVRGGRQDAELVLASIIVDGKLTFAPDSEDGLKVRAFTQYTNMRRGSVSFEAGFEANGIAMMMGVSNLYRGESFSLTKVIRDERSVGEIGLRYFAGNALFGPDEDDLMADLTGFGVVLNMKF